MIRTLFLVVLWLLSIRPAAAQLQLEDATGLPVSRVEILNETRVRESEIRHLFLLEPGDLYSPAKVQRSLKYLAEKVEIHNVEVRGRLEDGQLVLTLRVEPATLVYSVDIEGARELKESAVLSRLRVRIDRPLREADLRRDELTIGEMMSEAGYPRATVQAKRRAASGPHWERITFQVSAGEPRRIKRIESSIELPMEPWRLRALLGLKEGSAASQPQLREGVKLLEQVLRRPEFGYPETRVRGAQFRDETDGTVLVLPVRLGEITDVRVEGIDEWSARPLRTIYKARFGEPIDSAWLESMVGEMRESLLADGYHSARVAWEEGRKYGRRRITFRVERGPRYYVEEVAFDGNLNLSSRKLSNYMSLLVNTVPLLPPPFTRQALDRDLKVLASYYATKGYLDARVAVLDQQEDPSGAVRLKIHVDEGKSYHYGDIRWSGVLGLPEAELLEISNLRTGSRADPGALDRARANLLSAYAAVGRSHVEVRIHTEKDGQTGTVNVMFQITGGPPEYFGKVVISGNVRTQTKVITRELTFRQGDPWDPEQVARSRRRIYRLGFFRSVRILALPAALEGGQRDVRVEVEEQDCGSLTFGFGYGSEEGLKGYASIGHTNLQGYGRSLDFRVSFDNFDESYALNFREPWLFNNRLDLRLSLLKTYQNRDAYDLSSLAFQPALEKELSERLRGSLVYTLEQDSLSSIRDPKAVNDENLNDYLLSSIGPVLAWDSRDDPFNPRWGQYHTVKVEYALSALGSQVTYNRYSASLSGFLSLGKHTLALYGGGGIAQRFGQTVELPLNKRFFIGGRDTVRGYDRDEIGPTAKNGTPIGGDTMLNAKAEWRYPLLGNLRGVLFWDAGNVWNRAAEDPQYNRLRHGVGGGLRYVTPVGPVSLDLGWKVKRRGEEAPQVWHFTVGNVF